MIDYIKFPLHIDSDDYRTYIFDAEDHMVLQFIDDSDFSNPIKWNNRLKVIEILNKKDPDPTFEAKGIYYDLTRGEIYGEDFPTLTIRGYGRLSYLVSDPDKVMDEFGKWIVNKLLPIKEHSLIYK